MLMIWFKLHASYMVSAITASMVTIATIENIAESLIINKLKIMHSRNENYENKIHISRWNVIKTHLNSEAILKYCIGMSDIAGSSRWCIVFGCISSSQKLIKRICVLPAHKIGLRWMHCTQFESVKLCYLFANWRDQIGMTVTKFVCDGQPIKGIEQHFVCCLTSVCPWCVLHVDWKQDENATLAVKNVCKKLFYEDLALEKENYHSSTALNPLDDYSMIITGVLIKHICQHADYFNHWKSNWKWAQPKQIISHCTENLCTV